MNPLNTFLMTNKWTISLVALASAFLLTLVLHANNGSGNSTERQQSFSALRDSVPAMEAPVMASSDSIYKGYVPSRSASAEQEKMLYESLKSSFNNSPAAPELTQYAPVVSNVAAVQEVDFSKMTTTSAKAGTNQKEVIASVLKTTRLLNGGKIELRLLDDIVLPDSQVIAKQTVVIAKCDIGAGRIRLDFQRARSHSGQIVQFSVDGVIDYYDLRDDVYREMTLRQLKKEEKNRQLRSVANSTLASVSSTVEGQFMPVTGGLLTNLARISTQASSHIPQATLPEGYLVILQINP